MNLTNYTDVSSDGDVFTTFRSTLRQRTDEIKELLTARTPWENIHLFIKDFEGLETAISALERDAAEVREMLRLEAEEIPQLEAMGAAMEMQQQHLKQIETHLPARLPNTNPQVVPAASSVSAGVPAGKENARPMQDVEAAREKTKPKPVCPKWYITLDEFDSVSSYMKGRLTAEKVNAALDELAGLAESNYRLLSSSKSSHAASSRLTKDDQKKASLVFDVAAKAALKGKYWFIESDLAQGSCVKLDKAGKTTLTVLRHLRRLQEERMDHARTVVYTLQHQP